MLASFSLTSPVTVSDWSPSTFSLRAPLTWTWLSPSISSFLVWAIRMSTLPPAALPLADGQLHVALDVLDLVAADVQVLVLVDVLEEVAPLAVVGLVADDQVAVADDPLHRVVLDPDVHVPLGVDEDLLLALGVDEPELVVARRPPWSCCS